MAHHIYTTPAFIIESSPHGEANKSYLIFTKELGMIRATAQGVRLLKSKLRFSLQDFSITSLSIVRGKDIWRVTNAQLLSNIYTTYKSNTQIVQIIAHIFSLLKRLMPGEEQHEKLFITLDRAFTFLYMFAENLNKLQPEEILSLECIIVLNILFELGYLAPTSELQQFIDPVWARELLHEMNLYRKNAYQAINTSLKETQL